MASGAHKQSAPVCTTSVAATAVQSAAVPSYNCSAAIVCNCAAHRTNQNKDRRRRQKNITHHTIKQYTRSSVHSTEYGESALRQVPGSLLRKHSLTLSEGANKHLDISAIGEVQENLLPAGGSNDADHAVGVCSRWISKLETRVTPSQYIPLCKSILLLYITCFLFLIWRGAFFWNNQKTNPARPPRLIIDFHFCSNKQNVNTSPSLALALPQFSSTPTPAESPPTPHTHNGPKLLRGSGLAQGHFGCCSDQESLQEESLTIAPGSRRRQGQVSR